MWFTAAPVSTLKIKLSYKLEKTCLWPTREWKVSSLGPGSSTSVFTSHHSKALSHSSVAHRAAFLIDACILAGPGICWPEEMIYGTIFMDSLEYTLTKPIFFQVSPAQCNHESHSSPWDKISPVWSQIYPGFSLIFSHYCWTIKYISAYLQDFSPGKSHFLCFLLNNSMTIEVTICEAGALGRL